MAKKKTNEVPVKMAVGGPIEPRTESHNRTVGTPSVSGPSGPSKVKPSVEYAPNSLGEGTNKIVTDGKTQVKTTADSAAVEHIYGGNPDISRALRQHEFNTTGKWPPCLNTSCKSYMKPHPNCLCYGALGVSELAHGGEVCSSSSSHNEKCEHFADGGNVAENMMVQNNPKDTLDHVAVHHGLLGLLTKTGHSKSEDPHKPISDYMDHSRRGHKTLHDHMENLFTDNHIEPDKNSREALKAHLQDLRENPEKLLDVGGNLGGSLPSHAMHLAAKAGDAVNHFNAIKPKQIKSHPLDEISPVDKTEENTYNRHIDLAQNPATILNHVKDGTLLPSDVSTLTALYPELLKSIVDKAGEALINAKTKNMEIPYKQKQSLSLLMGQPLDATQTPQAMQAIINSQGQQQAQQQQRKQPKKASGVELKAIGKSDSMYETPLQRRQIDKKS